MMHARYSTQLNVDGVMRHETRGIVFRQEWVGEDEKLTPTESTKKFLASTMEGVEVQKETGKQDQLVQEIL